MSKVTTLINLINKKPAFITWAIFCNFSKLPLIKLMSDKFFLKLAFRISIKRRLNLKAPKTFNEKLQWLKLNDRNPEYPLLVDKFEVRKFIADKIGSQYLVQLINVYNSIDEINFGDLPEKFVIKCTHDSGSTIICRNKAGFDIENAKKKLKKNFSRNIFWQTREWPYKNIKPRIICEELLVDNSHDDLIDYKILCFNGEPKCLFLCLDRRSPSGLKVDFYDLNWNPLPFERHYPRSGRLIEKPECFKEMLDLSRILSKGIPFVRVDFYIVNKKIKFSELTFYPGSGFEEFSPESFDYLLGSWIDLSIVKKEM